jgi:hypothetical protein
VEDGVLVAFALWSALADGSKVFGGLWDNIVEELEEDASGLLWIR